MSDEDWRLGYAKSLAVYLNGRGISTTDPRGRRVIDDSFLILFNAHHDPVHFTLSEDIADLDWEVILYSADGLSADLPAETPLAGDIDGWTVAVLRKRVEGAS